MWLINANLALFTDLYELTMAHAYDHKGMDQTGYFEVFVRRLTSRSPHRKTARVR